MAKNGRKLQIIVKFQKLLNMVKKLEKIEKFTKMYIKAKNGQKMAKFKTKISSFFWLEPTSKNLQWAETAKNGFKSFKMH